MSNNLNTSFESWRPVQEELAQVRPCSPSRRVSKPSSEFPDALLDGNNLRLSLVGSGNLSTPQGSPKLKDKLELGECSRVYQRVKRRTPSKTGSLNGENFSDSDGLVEKEAEELRSIAKLTGVTFRKGQKAFKKKAKALVDERTGGEGC